MKVVSSSQSVSWPLLRKCSISRYFILVEADRCYLCGLSHIEQVYYAGLSVRRPCCPRCVFGLIWLSTYEQVKA